MIMIPMNCPSCGVHGRVPKTLVNVRLLCKKCQEPFHMSMDGVALIGDPPPPPGSERAAEDTTLDDPGEIVDLWLQKIANVLKLILKVAAGVAVVAGLSVLYTTFKPNTLLGRGDEAGEAILRDNLPKFNELAATDTGIDLFEWYGFLRPKLDELRSRVPGKDMAFMTKLKAENSADHTAEIILRFGARNELGRREITTDEELTGQARMYMDVRTIWKADGFGRWWIDGSRTLRGPG